ncbi:MAG TPA: EAL domain-containing protein [Leptospiraceae bacterium]|nr:EAL domain-containing protein [Leptospiraceae bacterium]HMX31751.1 EAL domain-containing protein [Leptospiraceae bacterium]HMY30557.1 EAL domain-containing protein [Leptospiraceae bacterium]HMZ64142.1 EAL domain-containing protein [Leptospiraceae bacterium]HNA08750.1 EAL domain-containing protein [Leptospiraceae bacterium]
MDWHSLLKRQIKKHCTDNYNQFIEQNEKFLLAIDEAYNRFDADRLMIERSLELTSQELMEKNKSLLNYIEKLNFIAYHDTLTHLYNRAYLIDKLEEKIKAFHKNPDKTFALLFLEVDRFKIINDAFGHSMGDKLLIKIASRINQFSSENITIARLGGDEFVLLIENYKSEEETLIFANQIISILSPAFKIDYHEVFVTVSIGIAFSNLSYESPADILRDADTAMFYAKKMGRGRVQIFQGSMHNSAAFLIELESNLRQAIDKNEFILYYQPILNASGTQVNGLEALIRWNHPSKGFISPVEFIPIAEETGMINAIGEWVIRNAVSKCKSLQSLHYGIYISVNLSFVQFKEKNITEIISKILKEEDLDPKLFYIELTESSIMENVFEGIEILNDLRNIGVKLSLDDFGTGYSSLSYLKKFPIHNLKIDQSFVRDIEKGMQDQEIVKAIISVAHSLGLSVTAEGIENRNQLTFLQSCGCDRLQGYFFSKPFPPEEIEEFFNKIKNYY